MILATFDIPRQDSGNSAMKSFNRQDSLASEETFYGRFRMLVKQRYFGIKLEERTFMEFIDSNPKMKDELGEFVDFMSDLKSEFVGYLKKNHPEKVEKRKKKRKPKRKDCAGQGDAPGHCDSFSGEQSGVSWKDEIDKIQSEMHFLKTKIENIKNDCCFELVGNVKRIIDLVDDAVAKLKVANDLNLQQRTQQIQQLSPPGLFDSLTQEQEPDDISYYFPGVTKTANKPAPEVPVSTDIFQELYFSINKGNNG